MSQRLVCVGVVGKCGESHGMAQAGARRRAEARGEG